MERRSGEVGLSNFRIRRNAHEEMGVDVCLGGIAQFVSETFCERFDGGFGGVVGRISSVRGIRQSLIPNQDITYGGFVIPCLEPVLMITDWFS